MTIYLKKFGTTLLGRDFAREAIASLLPTLKKVKDNEKVEIDFEGVSVFTPGWGHEVLSFLIDKFGNRVIIKNTTNPSVKPVLDFLEDIHKIKFNIVWDNLA